MIYYKPLRAKHEIVMENIRKDVRNKEDLTFGFMLNDYAPKLNINELFVKRNLKNMDEVEEALYNRFTLEDLNNISIAFWCDKIEHGIQAQPHFIGGNKALYATLDGTENCYNYVAIVDSIKTNSPMGKDKETHKFNMQTNFIANVLSSFNDEGLYKMHFFRKYGIFENINMVTLSNKGYFRFFGKWTDGRQVIDNGEIHLQRRIIKTFN